ncbi:hypothetical protein F2Q68_00005398 [Brassica cretica]|uniref:Uncharacterized protein n=1 Tax=Brassica cretica TaxID=69181 RepID=A0A8S9JNF9_BRACR|nr:hypothetical protein F2Q68_00005398 [Brassica cretica]
MVLCRAFLEDPGHVFPESEDLEIHPSETHDSWVRFFINRRLCGLSSRNPEAGWTFVLEPRGWMDSRPGTRKAGWSLVMEPGGCRVNPFFRPGGRPLSMSFFRCCILPFILRSYLDLEIMWEPGGSPFDPEIVSGPGGHVGTKRLLWTQRSFGNPEVPLALEVVLNPGLYKNLEVYLFQALRCFHDPETAWGPKGTVLRLPRKSLTGLEGAGVGVMTQVLGFAAFHVWRRRDLVIPFIDLEAWMDARVGAGASLNRNLEAGASPRQDIAPVILLSQVLLRSGPCSNLEENKFAWDRPGSSRRFQVLDLLIDDLVRFKTLIAFHWMSRLIHGARGLKSIDLGRFRILALHVNGWQDSDKRDLSSWCRTSVAHSHIFPGSEWHMTGARKRIIDLLLAYVPP